MPHPQDLRQEAISEARAGAFEALLSRLPQEARAGIVEALRALRADPAAALPAARARLEALIERAERLRAPRLAAEARFVGKLARAGRLCPSLLVSALAQRRLELFEAALARLGPYDPEAVRAAVRSPGRPEGVALALAGVGIDKSAFPDLLDALRSATGGLPGGGAVGLRRGLAAFGPFAPPVAARAFRAVWAPPAAAPQGD